MGLGWVVIDCSLGFYGKLQGESLWAGVWLDTLDRSAWMLLSKVVLYSGSSLDQSTDSLKDVYVFQASYMVGQQAWVS